MGAFLLKDLTANKIKATAKAQLPYAPMLQEIEAFWLQPANRKAANWRAHHDINQVMLATSLSHEGFLKLIRARME